MQRLRWVLPLAAAVSALAALPRTAPAIGTIDTSGATIAAGTAPTQGVVTIDASAATVPAPLLPSNDPLGSLGSMPGSLPAFTGGPGGAAIVIPAQGAALPGGTYNCSTYTVVPGGMAVYGGAVTIVSTGDVQIDGLVTTTGTGQAISIVCGGNLRIISHTGAFTSGISTTGANSPISVDVAGNVTTTSADGSGSWISAASGPVTVLAHDGSASGLMSLQNTTVISNQGGDAVVQGAGGLSILTAFVQSNGGSAIAQAFGADAVLQTGAVIGANNALLESAGRVTISVTSTVAGANTVGVTAYGGDLAVSASNVTQSGGAGDVTVRASGSVSVGTTSSVTCQGNGLVTLTAFGGTAKIEQAGAGTASSVRTFGVGDTSVLASGDIVVAGTGSQVRANQSAVRLRSAGGAVSVRGDCSLEAPTGVIDVRASQGFSADQDSIASPGTYPAIDGRSLLVSAGPGGIAAVCDPVTTQNGPLTLLTTGSVVIASNLTSNGPLTIQSTQGDVTAVGRTLTTGAAGAKSGDVRIACFGGSSAKIDVSTSTVRSGDHATASGNVTLEVHAPVAPPSVDGALVPSKITVKPVKDSTDKRIVASGVIDFGGDEVPLVGVAKVTVGDLENSFVLDVDRKGRAVHKSDALTLRITPSKLGTSRAAFSLSAVGDASGFLDAEGTGTVAIRFERGTFKAGGLADVTAGKFVLGAKRGTLTEPGFRIVKAHGVVKEGPEDKLDLELGVGGTEAAPEEAPNVTLAFGDSFSVSIPGTAFVATGDGEFTAKDLAQGVKTLVLDFAHEKVVFKGRKIELGDVGAGLSVPLTCTLTLGDDTRTFTFRMAHRGSALIY
jgi:hypothetical protein